MRAPPSRSERFIRKAGARPWVLGHRGARHAAPENTLRAFELARFEGADGVELDVRLDADGNVIVLHDVDLARVSGGLCRARADALSASALSAVDIGAGERVPRLGEVLSWAKRHDLIVNVELKSDVSDRRGLLDALVGELGDEPEHCERVLLSSFDPRFVFALSRHLPDYAVCWLVHAKQRVLRHAPAYRWLGAVGVHPEHSLLSLSRVSRLKAEQALVNTWTVNDPELARAYANFGVDALISDCPGKLLAAFE